MTLRDRYAAVVQRAVAEDVDGLDALPLVLVEACVEVLPVDGAGLSLTDELRIPLSASSALVTQAERLQTTLGEGPCLAATELGEALVADLARLEDEWPAYCSELVRLTPFRSVASVPLTDGAGDVIGAVDLYFTAEQPMLRGALSEIRSDVTDQMATRLLASSAALDGDRAAPGGGRGVVRERLDVWVAIGMVLVDGGLSNRDALAVLRAYAFGHELTLDELAAQVVSRAVTVDVLLGQPGGRRPSG